MYVFLLKPLNAKITHKRISYRVSVCVCEFFEYVLYKKKTKTKKKKDTCATETYQKSRASYV